MNFVVFRVLGKNLAYQYQSETAFPKTKHKLSCVLNGVYLSRNNPVTEIVFICLEMTLCSWWDIKIHKLSCDLDSVYLS